ncbi:hypothetical protein [Kineococcus sp. SYSU DK005]|uniref:hypothetical protein n=1 Tax=Kineococcus sp. SYSU DK005 TaxID=3383126 RepID=UPI003D7E307B
MQVQYVVDLDVRLPAAPTSTAAHAALLRHVQQWLEFAHRDVPDLAALPADGSTALHRREDVAGADPAWSVAAGPRQLSWRRVGTADAFAQRIDLRAPVPGGRATHVTGVTLSADRRREVAVLRVVTGRESHQGWLAPAPSAFLRRPAVVRRVVQDPGLHVSVAGQRVDGRRTDVKLPLETAVLIDALGQPARLPVLLIAPTLPGHLAFADAAALELPGLATVVCVRSLPALTLLARRHPQLELTPGAARLAWPGLGDFEHPLLPAAQLASTPAPDLVDELIRTIAPLSVVARGVDVPYRRAERAERALGRVALTARLTAAEAAGDTAGTIEVLKEQLVQARGENEQWLEEVHRLEGQVADLTAALGRVHRAPGEQCPEPPAWESAPPLTPDDADPLLDFLERRSERRLRFTADVARTWRKSRYAHPQLMREALIKLGRASVAFAETQGSMNARLGEWFRDEHGLEVATTDLKLKESGRARFDFEGFRGLDGVPHVKLGDAKSWRECGRIYFAYQSEPARFVVHHVGLHDL